MPTEANIIPAEENNAPAQENEPNRKVTFDAAQTAKVNEIVKDAMGRAGGESRAEVIRLQKELDKLKTSPSIDDVINIEVRAENAKRQLAETQASIASATLRNVLLEACAGYIDPEFGVLALAGNVKIENGNVMTFNQHGSPRINQYGDPMTVQELAKEFGDQRPWMVRSEVRPGAGSSESHFGVSGNGKYVLEELFGPKSNSKKANDLAIHDKKKYKELRLKAVEQGLVV